jgi:hypothetical protein
LHAFENHSLTRHLLLSLSQDVKPVFSTAPLSRMESALLELLDNAIRALSNLFPHGRHVHGNVEPEVALVPTIKVQVLHDSLEETELQTDIHDHGPVAFVLVCDNGGGISPEAANFVPTSQDSSRSQLRGLSQQDNLNNESTNVNSYGARTYEDLSTPEHLFSGSLSFYGRGMKDVSTDDDVQSFRYVTRTPLGSRADVERAHSKGEFSLFIMSYGQKPTNITDANVLLQINNCVCCMQMRMVTTFAQPAVNPSRASLTSTNTGDSVVKC